MIKWLLIILSAVVSLSLSAKTVQDVEFQDTIEVNKEQLLLNGIGIRKATFLAVKVYVGGLYVSKKTSNWEEILKQSGAKHIRMSFLRTVGVEKLRDGWKTAFNDSKADQNKFQKEIEQFLSLLIEMQEKDEMSLTFTSNALEIEIKSVKNSIPNGDFATAVLSVWFINPSDPKLRDGLLGLEQ